MPLPVKPPRGGASSTAIHDNVDAEISAITEKTTLVAADLVLIEDSAAANAKKKAQVGNLVTPLIGDGSELTIATGVVTVTGGFHTVDTEADAATDDLDTINGGTTGHLLVLTSAVDARDPTVKDATGNLALAGDFTLDDSDDTITLIYNGSNWLEVSRSNNT